MTIDEGSDARLDLPDLRHAELPEVAYESALAGFNVLDLSDNIAGAYCTKLLADLGADVAMVERPEIGHPLRHVGPFPGDEPHPDKSGMFMCLCANKRSLTADPATAHGRRTVLRLAQRAHLIVESFAPGRLSAQGLGFDVLRRLNPGVVLTSISHFGQTGPYRNWRSSEIVDNAMGGYMYFCGDAEREPLMLPNDQPQINAGAQAAAGSLAAMWHARRIGRGQQVDVSTTESMLSAHAWTATSWTHEGVVMRRTEPDCIKCEDGWIWFMTMRWDPTMFILIEKPELMEDPRWADRQDWITNIAELRELVAEWCATRKKADIFRTAQELRLAFTPVDDAADLVASEQLAARQWFNEVRHPIAGAQTLPGFPYKLGATPAAVKSAAPLLGTDNGMEFDHADAGRVWTTRSSVEPERFVGTSLPLEGIRILEITANWAGPLAGRYLGDLGAEVIKIESPDRPMTRGGRYPGGDPAKYHYNRAGYFNKMNRNKYGLTLDLNTERGKELFLELVSRSDVVLENNSPRVMRNFGLEYDVLKQANPEIVFVSVSGFGQTGPQRDYVAYGANIEATCGLAASMGYPDDERPYRTALFYADPVTAIHAAVAIQAALHHCQQGGGGQFIDMSLNENGIAFFPEAVLEYTIAGRVAQRRGNRHREFAPQGCYRSIGDDAWVVLSVTNEDQWSNLAKAIGRPDLADDERYSTAAKRRELHDELDELISEWTARYDHNEATGLLQAAGVPAGPVLANWELISNPHFHERGFYVPVEHPEMGVFPYPGMPWKLSDTPAEVRMASPCFGQHNRLILQDLLELTDEEVAGLYEDRIIADEPPANLPGPVRFPR